MKHKIITDIAAYIFSKFDIHQFEKNPIGHLKIDLEESQEDIRVFGYKLFGFKFILCNTSSLYEEGTFELRMIIQYEDKIPYGIIFDDNDTYKAYVFTNEKWVNADVLSMASLLMALEHLDNAIAVTEKIKTFDTELIRNFIINVY
jgi:hypothetical protein